MMTDYRLDATDRRIVSVLAENSRTAVAQIAAAIGISRARVTSRIEGLIRKNILSFTAKRNLRFYGYTVIAVIDITLDWCADEEVMMKICDIPGVFVGTEILGPPHFYVFCATRGVEELYNVVHKQLRQVSGVKKFSSSVVLSVPKRAREFCAITKHGEERIEVDSNDIDEIIIDHLQEDARRSRAVFDQSGS